MNNELPHYPPERTKHDHRTARFVALAAVLFAIGAGAQNYIQQETTTHSTPKVVTEPTDKADK